jgi:uncharacterized protein
VKKSKQNPSTRRGPASASPATGRRGAPLSTSPAPPVVSARWLLIAIVAAVAGAILCAWGTLCILFWQGSWQLLYHPTATLARTPVSVNLPFESVGFATTASGNPQLRGWWIPASTSQPRYTVLYLHQASGNLADTVDDLARLHALGLNIFAFDYRGYGQSVFLHPSEARWQQDADSAIKYLTDTRHLDAGSLILVGKDLGANLALETAASHSDLAGIVLEDPLEFPTTAIFNDARARIVPAHLLVSDRWDTDSAASSVLIPSLWVYWTTQQSQSSSEDRPQAYEKTQSRKRLVWLTDSPREVNQFNSALSKWLDELPGKAH